MPNDAELNIKLKARNETGQAFKQVERQTQTLRQRLNTTFTRLRRNLRNTKNQIMGIAAALGAFEAVRGLAEFNNELARTGQLGADARSRLDEYRGSVQALAIETGTSLNSLNDGLFNVISAGTDAANAIGVLTEANKLAVAGSSDLTSSVQGLSVVANAFNINSQEGFADLAQSLFAAQVIGRTTVQELSGSVGRLASVAANSNIPLDELFTAFADLTTVTSSTEEAATSLRAALVQLQKPGAELERIMRNVGIESGRAAFEGRTLGEVFTLINQEAERLDIPMAKVLGNIRGVTAAVNLGAENGQRFNDALARQRQMMGELEPSYQLMKGTLSSTTKSFMNLARVVSMEFTQGLITDLPDSLEQATKNARTMGIEARIMGLRMRKSLEPVLTVLRAIGRAILFLGESFGLVLNAFDLVFIKLQELFAKIVVEFQNLPGIDWFFTTEVEGYNQAIKEQAEKHQELNRQLAETKAKLNDLETQEQQAIRNISLAESLGDDVPKYRQILNEVSAARSDLQREYELTQNKLLALDRTDAALARKREALIAGGVRALPGGTPNQPSLLDEDSLSPEQRAARATNNIAFDRATDDKLDQMKGNIVRLQELGSNLFTDLSSGIVNTDLFKEIDSEIASLKAKLAETGDTEAAKSETDNFLQYLIEAKRRYVESLVTTEQTWYESLKETSQTAWIAFKEGAAEALEGMKSLEESFTDLGRSAIDNATNALASFFDSVVDGSDRGKEAFNNFIRNMARQINKILAEKATQQFIQMISAAFTSTVTPLNDPDFTAQRYGIQATPGEVPLADGGIVTGPTRALIGEAGPEAVIPLKRGSVPVTMNSGASQTVFNINISAVDGPSVERLLSSESGRRAIEGAMRNARSVRRDLR